VKVDCPDNVARVTADENDSDAFNRYIGSCTFLRFLHFGPPSLRLMKTAQEVCLAVTTIACIRDSGHTVTRAQLLGLNC